MSRDKIPDLAARVARLTPGQRACLDLVDDHATSKEIARQLGISRHTVDARLRQAMQILGVTSRREAAIIWRAAAAAEPYQPFAYQPSQLEPGQAGADSPGYDRGQPIPPALPAFLAGEHAFARPSEGCVAEAAVVAWETPPAIPQPPPIRLWGGANDLTTSQRLASILIVSILAMLAFGLLLSGISALTQLRT
ncbi:helix-turn-helix domain-containing protein [Thermaurantiacus sp.]